MLPLFARALILDFWLLMPLMFSSGYLIGRWHNRHWRRDRLVALGRRYQLLAARIENKGMRRNRRRPSLSPWQKFVLGVLHWFSPTLTRYTLFRPETLIGWFHRYACSVWWLTSKTNALNPRGRPRIPAAVVKIIVSMKRANPRYGAQRIAALVSRQLGMPVSATTVRNVLQRHFKTYPPGTPPSQSWETFLTNHREVLGSIDFKVVYDLRVRPLFILSILSHDHRKLLHCRCTYNPTAQWVSQQLREAFPFDEGPGKLMMDHDSIFLPVIKSTLPGMGIGVVRTDIKCPWQNGVIERFNRTLKDELLAHVVPLGDRHLNRLLGEFQAYYNTGRPHRANAGLTPGQAEASNDDCFFRDRRNLEAHEVEQVAWLSGLHHSYRRAA